MTWLVPLPVIVPLSAAGLALALVRFPRLQRVVSVAALSVVMLVSASLLVFANDGPLVVDVGGWAAPVGITLVVDRLAALMLTVSSFVTLCVLLYSLGQDVGDGDEDQAPVAIYHPTFLVLSAGVADAFVAGDLFNLYVAFEILLVASYVLLTLGATRARIRAGTIYVVVSLISSAIFLIAIALTYAATGTVNLAQLAERIGQIDSNVALVIELMLLIAFGIKAAIFPLSAWLPDSYPTAPAPVTAVFAGLLTKVGVYAIIRVQTLLFPESPVNGALMWAALATMIIGILGAVAQDDIKRLLSFTLVSHIGYMVFGIALATEAGVAAAIFYVAHHITVQTGLFLVVGLVERQGRSTRLDQLGGLAKTAPLVGILFFIPAMNLAGIPPFSGFVGKIGLFEAGAAVGSGMALTLIVGGAITSLLTLYAVVRVWNRAFWRPLEKPQTTVVKQSPVMVGSTMALVAAGLGIAVFGGPLMDYTTQASQAIRERTPYISAVLPDGDRGSGISPDAADNKKADNEETPNNTNAGENNRKTGEGTDTNKDDSTDTQTGSSTDGSTNTGTGISGTTNKGSVSDSETGATNGAGTRSNGDTRDAQDLNEGERP